MRVTFTFDYGTSFTGEELDQLEEITGKEVELKDSGDPRTTTRYIADLRKLLPITDEISLHGDEAPHHLLTLSDQLDRLEARLDEYSREHQHNERVNVHVANLGLLEVQHVILEEDCCTDRLEKYLSEGWRIIAVCPQPDQRRPDYILGHTDPHPEH
jgi:hypothetical protein